MYFRRMILRKLPFQSWVCATLVLILASSAVEAQDEMRDVVDQQMWWYMLFGNHRLTDQLGLHTEYQFRWTGLGADWQQSLLRVGLDWHRDDQYVVTGGYGLGATDGSAAFPAASSPVERPSTSTAFGSNSSRNPKPEHSSGCTATVSNSGS